MFVIVNNLGHELSGFYPNDCQNKLAYRKGDYYCYPTIEEAQEHLDYIQGHNVGKSLGIRTRPDIA